ncbi:hypothetical protein [Allomuricauda sp. NBRC 101325]|uniref:hypothetical protein n=1 Tax=Allomuricauda sp. NBRC 101325 TaxID=1113758 RepID=UPI0024A0137C|nr:hypothetical protein [Muricauda sp. NBRC 101325]GLU45001.1 hypothetical protein Musp01_26250 [Muricauda sp. NBRC 101325]
MWKEKLPINCPPKNAVELDTIAFRILENQEPEESDFLPYVHLKPDNKRYKSLCEAYALSSFDSVKNAVEAWKKALARGRNIGNYIAQIQIESNDGRNVHNKKSGHISTWLYDTRTSNQFKCDLILVIDEN